MFRDFLWHFRTATCDNPRQLGMILKCFSQLRRSPRCCGSGAGLERSAASRSNGPGHRATGQQGGAVARALLDRGHRVRGLARNTDAPKARQLEAQGAEVAAGELHRFRIAGPRGHRRDAVFCMTTPLEHGVEGETEQGMNDARRCRARGRGDT